MSLPNYLSAIKSAGIYRFVWDKSEIEGVDAETLRLVVGYSEKGPFNTPVYIKSATDFKTIFGGISRKLEKRGVFFHRLALQALLSGPIIALNLKKFSNISGKDEVQGVTLNSSIDILHRENIYDEDETIITNSDIKNISVEGVYDKVRFWNLSPETARESYAGTDGSTKYISIFTTDDSSTSKSFIIRGFKPSGYDITIKQWFSNFGEEMPDMYKPIEETLLNQYFAEIYVFEGEFTVAMAKSKELSKYFNIYEDLETEKQTVYLKPYILNAFGEKIDTLSTLAADKNSNFVKMYRGTTLPEFKDNNNNYISLNLVFNNDNPAHKLMMDFNTELLEEVEIDEPWAPAVLLNYLNTSGWYGMSDDDYSTTNPNIPVGLQACMEYIYNNVTIDNTVPEDYYSESTDINILGNADIVPDADIILTSKNEVYNTEEPEDIGVSIPSITSKNITTAQTSDGSYFITNDYHVYHYDGTNITDISEQTIIGVSETKLMDLLKNNSISMIENFDDKLLCSNGLNGIVIDLSNNYSYTSVDHETLKGMLQELLPQDSDTISDFTLLNGYIDTDFKSDIDILFEGQDNYVTYTYTRIPGDTDTLVENSSSYEESTKYLIAQLNATTNPSIWSSVDKHEKNTNNIYNILDFVNVERIDPNNTESEIAADAIYFNSEEESMYISSISENNIYTLQYVTTSISSDSKNGGDVQFLTMNTCYLDETFDTPIVATEDAGKFIPPTESIKVIYTDSFVNYGLQAGDKFLSKNGEIATLLSVEELYADTDNSMAPMVKYTFNKDVRFLVLQIDNDNNPQTGYEKYQLILVKMVNPFGIALSSNFQFTYLKGFEYSNPKPASNSQYDKLMWQWSILDTLTEYKGLRTGLTDKKNIDYRYVIDTFEGFVESECKSRLSLLAKEKDNCLALLNFPAIETFRKCPYTSFTDDKGQLDINYIPEGGNARKSLSMKFSLPNETNGASWSSFNTCVVLSDGTIKTTIPSAALVSNNFMEKYVSRQPYYIVAGPNYGKILDYQLVGPDFNFSRADLDALEPFGVNCMVYVPRIGTYINSNQTAKQNPVTALSKINIRELVIYLQDEIEKLLQSYQWEFNNQTLRDVIKTKADTICENVKNNGGLYEYLNVCDSSNNPPEVIDNEMIVLSTSIEGARGAGKMVQELTLYKTGGLKAMINNG